MMEIKKVYVKTRAEFGKQCIFDTYGPNMDDEIKPNPDEMNDYIVRSHCHVGVQHSRQLALHEIQSVGTTRRNSGMFHFEGGWPKEINSRDEEATARFRRRVEKDDDWAPKLRNPFKLVEQSVLQNGVVNIYEHYFDDMIPTELVERFGLRTVNVYTDPEKPARPVNDISWSPDSGSRIVVSYCFLEFGRQPDYSNTVYIWQVDNPNSPYMALEAFCPSVVSEFNPRDPSVIASGLMSGQVCNWDIRTGTAPVQLSHRQFSHRDYVNAVKWLPTKNNTEFFSTSSDGHAMWWDTRKLREPTESLMFDLENPDEPNIDRAIGVSCLNFGPVVGTKFMFGMENGIVVSGSRKAKSNAEKLALKFEAHYGPVLSVDRNVFNPTIFLTVGDWSARVLAEDTKEGCLVSTRFISEYPTGGCWNKSKHSVFYIITGRGLMMAWDLLQSLQDPVLTIQLCKERLTTIAPQEEGNLLAVGNAVGKVYLVEPNESLQSFDKKERAILSEYLERCSRFAKAVDTRVREIKLMQSLTKQEETEPIPKDAKAAKKSRVRSRTSEGDKQEKQQRSSRVSRERSRKSVPKDKKKIKDEFPELTEAEEKYFEIMEKEKEKLRMVDDAIQKSSMYWSSSSKKLDSKKVARKIPTATEKGAETTTKTADRKAQRAVKARSARPGAEIPERVDTEEKKPTEQPKHSSQITIKEQRSALDERREPVRGRGGKRRRMKRIPLKIPKSCKQGVCRPKVCCWRTDSRVKSKFSERKGRGARTVDRVSRKKETAGTVEGRKTKEEKSIGKEDQRKGGISASKLIDGRWSYDRSTKPISGEKVRVLRELTLSPAMLTQEVKRAKKEIRESTFLTGKVEKGYISRKVKRTRTRRRERSYKAKDSGKDYENFKAYQRIGNDAGARAKAGEKEDSATTFDPCSPREPKALRKEFQAFLGGPMLKSIEDKEEQGKAYLEEIEAARSRVYPRISEFHSIE